jgi:hypothetical protein
MSGRKLRVLVIGCAALALAVGVGTASAGDPGGNSDAAKACQKDGWKNLVRAEDHSAFKNVGDCVSYAAHGGTLTSPTPSYAQSQSDCEAAGGTFSTAPSPNYDTTHPERIVLWSCLGYTVDPLDPFAVFIPLALDCFADGGQGFGEGGPNWSVPQNSSCDRDPV